MHDYREHHSWRSDELRRHLPAAIQAILAHVRLARGGKGGTSIQIARGAHAVYLCSLTRLGSVSEARARATLQKLEQRVASSPPQYRAAELRAHLAPAAAAELRGVPLCRSGTHHVRLQTSVGSQKVTVMLCRIDRIGDLTAEQAGRARMEFERRVADLRAEIATANTLSWLDQQPTRPRPVWRDSLDEAGSPWRCPECHRTTFAQAIRSDRCMRCARRQVVT